MGEHCGNKRIALLDEIGMIWNVPDYSWEENFAGALAFYRKHGHLDIPVDYCAPNGLKIGTWIRRQRDLRAGKLPNGVPPTAKQIARLDEIGMVWKNKFETAWDRGYQAALAYHDEYGNLYVPTAYGSDQGFDLYEWVTTQRNKYRAGKLSTDKIHKLESIGMDWLTTVERT